MPETKEKYHHVPAKRKVKNNPIRTINLGEGIKGLYDTKRKVIVTYLFDKEKYTMKQAKEWVSKHKDDAAHHQVVANLVLVGAIDDFYKESKEEVIKALTNNDE